MAFSQQVNLPLHGVNLGGWLVLEKWLTPSLFAGGKVVDEYTLCATAAGRRKLAQHHKTFITETDFAWLAEHNVQAVRLPVGYWLFGDEPPFVGSIEYVDKAFKWAAKYGLKILFDLHGAPGSQNGTMHSGQVGEINWTSADNIAKTLEVLRRLGRRYGQSPALLGISFLNEPSPRIPAATLEAFYRQAFSDLQALCRPGSWLVFSDNFRPGRWRRRLLPSQFPNLYIDYHHYQIYSWLDKLLPANWQLWRASHTMVMKLRRMTSKHPVIIGEWSLTLRSEKISKLSTSQREQLAQAYGQAQLQTFASSAAWFYWTYKTENNGAWNYRAMVERGWL